MWTDWWCSPIQKILVNWNNHPKWLVEKGNIIITVYHMSTKLLQITDLVSDWSCWHQIAMPTHVSVISSARKNNGMYIYSIYCVYMAHLRYPANIFAFSWLVIYIYICSSIYIIPIHQFRQKTTSTNLRIPTVHDLNQGLHSSMQARSRGPAFVLLEGHLHAGPCVLVQCRSEHPKMKGTNRCDPF